MWIAKNVTFEFAAFDGEEQVDAWKLQEAYGQPNDHVGDFRNAL